MKYRGLHLDPTEGLAAALEFDRDNSNHRRTAVEFIKDAYNTSCFLFCLRLGCLIFVRICTLSELNGIISQFKTFKKKWPKSYASHLPQQIETFPCPCMWWLNLKVHTSKFLFRFVFNEKETPYCELLDKIVLQSLANQRLVKIVCTIFTAINNEHVPTGIKKLIEFRINKYDLRKTIF